MNSTTALPAPVLDLRPRPRRLVSLLRLARRKYMGTFAALVLLAFFGAALFAPLLAPYDPLEPHTDSVLTPPSASYLLGTDELGRDLASRLLYGARISLLVGFGAVTLQLAIGVTLGLTSGYFGGRFDLVTQRLIDALQAFPPLILALVMVATLGASVLNVILAVALIGIATKARVVRGATLSLMQNAYVESARTIGASHGRIMLRYILPNAFAPIVVLTSASLGTAIVAESSLSFLGLGPPPPNPTWGGMLSGNARSQMASAAWLALAPGVAITLVVLAFNLLGDALRDVLDPRLRGSR